MFSNLPGDVLTGVIVAIVVGVGYLARGMIGHLLALIPGLEPSSVRGTWDTKFFKEKEPREEVVELNQFLHFVWGTVKYERGKAGERELMTYKLRGIIRRDILAATYELKDDPDALDLGSFTLRIVDGLGRRMRGKYSWPDDETREPMSGDYVWLKRKAKTQKQEVE